MLVNRDSVTLYLLILLLLIDFSCWIALANISSTILNSSRDSRYPCWVSDLSGNASRVSPLRWWILGLRYIYHVKVSISSYFLEHFYQQEEIRIQAEGMGRKTQWQTWTLIKYASVLTIKIFTPLFIHPCHSLSIVRVSFPAPGLWG